MVIAVLGETPGVSLRGKTLKMFFKVYFVLEMEMLRISASVGIEIQGLMGFCLFVLLKILYPFLKLCFFVCAKQVSASAQTKSQLEQQLLIPNSVGFK